MCGIDTKKMILLEIWYDGCARPTRHPFNMRPEEKLNVRFERTLWESESQRFLKIVLTFGIVLSCLPAWVSRACKILAEKKLLANMDLRGPFGHFLCL